AIVAAFARDIRALGPANFLYADGDALFAHGDRRVHADGIRPPGLHLLSRRCRAGEARLVTEGLSIESSDGEQSVVLFASVPLTKESGWKPLGEGELICARRGKLISSATAA
ncbi:MAG: class II glutamine amidotransferase, partial [Burkholderiales bacterium]